jgi:RimJ/RimL family protein N-acetyltransferase
MIFEIPEHSYAKVQPLLMKYGFENHPIIQAIVQRFNRGKIYADQLEQPKTVLIWAFHELFFLIGDDTNEGFNRSLPNLIREKIAPVAATIQEDSFQLEVYPECTWRHRIEMLLATFSLNRYYRWSFRFDSEQYLYKVRNHIHTPHGYELRSIDRSVLEKDQEQTIAHEILKFWSSIDAFLRHGLGYCVLYQGTVVTTCLSVFACDEHYEIGINTYDKQHRGKGLATLAARAFIEACLAKQMTPHWSTESFRLDSIAIAEKLGFEKQNLYRCYYFLFKSIDGERI